MFEFDQYGEGNDFDYSMVGYQKDSLTDEKNGENYYRKVASSRPVYYSIFDLFWGATNQDVLLTEMCYYCYIQKSIKWWVHKGPCVFSSIFVNSQWLALFLQISFKNVLKTLGGTFLLLWKCIFISKNWKNLIRIFEDPTFWIYFSNQNVGSSRILIRFFQFLLMKCIFIIIRRFHLMFSIHFWMKFVKIGQVIVSLQKLNWIHRAHHALIIWLISGCRNSSTSRLVARLG